MTLHDAILHVLHQAGRPLSTREIADQINNEFLYERIDSKRVEKQQIQARVRQYSEYFLNINGQIIPTDDVRWKELLTAYWYVVDILRGYISISDLQFLIAFLFYFKRKFSPEYNREIIETAFHNFNRFIRARENQINDEFNTFSEATNILSQIDAPKRREIVESIFRLDLSRYSDSEFGNIFEYFLNLNSLDSSKSPIAYTPSSVRELMGILLKPRKGATVYDPVCGTGGLLIELAKSTPRLNFTASEVNQRVTQLCYMNFQVNGIENFELHVEDCFRRINDPYKYKYIIADLPINGVTSNWYHLQDLFHRYGIPPTKSVKGFGYFLLFILSKLEHEGMAVVTVADSFLSKGGKEGEIRKRLVLEDKIQAVLSLPYGALRPYTDAKASILVLHNSKRTEDVNKIRFVKIESLEITSKSIMLDIHDDILKSAMVVERDELAEGFNLAADMYDPSQVEAKNLLKKGAAKELGALVEIRSGTTPERKIINKNSGIPMVRVENLSRDIIDVYLNKNELVDGINYEDINPRYLVNEDCILIARLGDTLKPTLFKSTDDFRNIIVHSGVHVLKPLRNADIDLEYLYYQLRSEFVIKQVNKRRLGSVVPYISISSLKNVAIPYVDIQSQRQFVNTQKSNIISNERTRIEEKIKALGYKEEIEQKEADIVNTLAHQLRPTLANLDLEVKSLNRILAKNNLLDLKEFTDEEISPNSDPELQGEISTPRNYSIKDLTEKISTDALHINNVLDTIKKVLSFKLSEADMEEVDLLDFLDEYVNQKRIEINNRYEVDVKGDHFVAQFSKTAFSDLLNQLFINAEVHGFDFRSKKNKYRILFSIRKNSERGIAIIEYQNNGKKYLLSQKDYVTPLVKSADSKGNGIGGNYINRIIEAHNGVLSIRENVSQGFFMTIEIPLKQDNTYE